MKGKVLITGVGGFIGSKVAEVFLREGYEVVGMDNLDPYYPPEYKRLRIRALHNFPGFTFYEGDFTDPEDVAAVLTEDLEGVLHIGAKAGVRASIEDPEAYLRANTVGTLRILEGMRSRGIGRIVMASTSSIYAGHPAPFREDMKTDRPISPYAVSKKAAENLLYTYHHLYGIDAFVLRYFTVYGPYGRPDMSIFKLLYAALSGETFPLYGDGSQRRSFSYVDDVARATYLAFQRVEGYEIINVGNPDDHPLSSVISLIEELSGRRVNLRRYPFNRADIPITKASIEKARRLLGWEPEISLREGLRRTAEWFIGSWETIRRIFPTMPSI
ncbi:MAG: NAD-dependent epimerase/dehydratase family protein [Thermotogae bacterium]|nr:NAD-dependent epimerase/dehydratase family protein [Thermotogota bacterium]